MENRKINVEKIVQKKWGKLSKKIVEIVQKIEEKIMKKKYRKNSKNCVKIILTIVQKIDEKIMKKKKKIVEKIPKIV